jgi:hypothetical protein
MECMLVFTTARTGDKIRFHVFDTVAVTVSFGLRGQAFLRVECPEKYFWQSRRTREKGKLYAVAREFLVTPRFRWERE